jgi:adrenodoxin-NADP+ reductase
VHVIGRRGPLQVAFKTKELREISKISDFSLHIDQKVLSSNLPSDLSQLPRARRRLAELMMEIATKKSNFNAKQCHIQFLRSPRRIVHKAGRNILQLTVNKLIESGKFEEDARIESNDEIQDFEFDLLIRSIGYRAVSIDPCIPMNEKSGIIENDNGRISKLGPGMYCSGWAATGATGVIVGTMNSALSIGERILQDITQGHSDSTKKPGREQIMQLLRQQNVKVVSFQDWQKIDNLERQRGQNKNKPREKFVSTDDILKAI